jgi:hypothetical protein
VILLGEGISRLRRYPLNYGGINVDELLTSSATFLTTLQELGPEKIDACIGAALTQAPVIKEFDPAACRLMTSSTLLPRYGTWVWP